MTKPKSYTKWKGTPIRKARPSSRSESLAEEKRMVDEAHRQRKLDFLAREKQRNERESTT
jgi:hypothetical protein